MTSSGFVGKAAVARRRKKTPEILEALAKIMEHETAGDPVSGCKWTLKSTKKIARELRRAGCWVSPKTVARLLKEMGFSLRINTKTVESGGLKPRDPDVRDRQFRYIKRQRLDFARRNMPIISVDTKSRELIGQFHTDSRHRCRIVPWIPTSISAIISVDTGTLCMLKF